MKSKLEIITGFLGSGKTSFINSYLNTEIWGSLYSLLYNQANL